MKRYCILEKSLDTCGGGGEKTQDGNIRLSYIVDALLRCLTFDMQVSGRVTFVFMQTTLAEPTG